jgi:hypothetical protein
MTITVNTAGKQIPYPNADAFEIDDDNNLIITQTGNTVAAYFTWDSVDDDQYNVDTTAPTAPATAEPEEPTTAPPAPTPVVEAPVVPVTPPTDVPATDPTPVPENAVPTPPAA